MCRNDALRAKVNGLLAVGASYAMILRAIEDDNTSLDTRDRVTIDSIRNHTARHFPVQNVARATYREILERRAKENGVDFVNGVATAITPMAFFETVMANGYETLVDSDTKVDVSTGMIAAARLQALMESRASGTSMIDMWVKMDKIINAIKSTVPEEMWGEIVRKLDGDDEIKAGGSRKTFLLDGQLQHRFLVGARNRPESATAAEHVAEEVFDVDAAGAAEALAVAHPRAGGPCAAEATGTGRPPALPSPRAPAGSLRRIGRSACGYRDPTTRDRPR